jgi:hypothetical protein
MADETNTPTPDSAPQALPDTANIADAAALMDRLDAGDDAPPKPPAPDAPDPGNAQPEGNEVVPDDDVADDVDLPADDEETVEQDAAGLNDAPSFWSPEDKAAWATIPPQLRPLLKKYEQQRTEYAESKAQEAARIRQEAIDYAKQAADVVTKGAEWWQTNGPTFFKAFGDRWAQVDWNTLADQNPARGRGSSSAPGARARPAGHRPSPAARAGADRGTQAVLARTGRPRTAEPLRHARARGQDLRHHRQVSPVAGHRRPAHQRHSRGPDHQDRHQGVALRSGQEQSFDRRHVQWDWRGE